MRVFPDAFHFLIESDPNWISTYSETYREIPYVALNWFADDSSHRIDSIRCEGPILLKIDVDGPELRVLDGCRGLLAKVAVVVIEATMDHVASISEYLDSGFVLFDIVDLCYCGPQLHQCDLVFVNRAVEHLVKVPFDLEKYQDSSLLDRAPELHQN